MRVNPWLIVSDDAYLADEATRRVRSLGLPAEAAFSPKAFERVAVALGASQRVALALLGRASSASLVEMARLARVANCRLPLALLEESEAGRPKIATSLELGLPAVSEVGPLASCIALITAEAEDPWTTNPKNLPALQRLRLREAFRTRGQSTKSSTNAPGRLIHQDDGSLAWRANESSEAHAIGTAADAAAAIIALRDSRYRTRSLASYVDGVDHQQALDIIFGPKRSLSDPSSKAALEPYGIALPTEELCTSASRAAAEATRIGFPVRMALASPDLRVWDHPDLCADGVDNAASVRDIYRQIIAMAESRAPKVRLLGVLITETQPASALLRMVLQPLADDRVLLEIGFADPHGAAAADCTVVVLPADIEHFEASLQRLRGRSLLLEPSRVAQTSRRLLESLHDTCQRIATFVHHWRHAVESVEVHPLAILLTGNVEIREACVHINDAFEREL